MSEPHVLAVVGHNDSTALTNRRPTMAKRLSINNCLKEHSLSSSLCLLKQTRMIKLFYAALLTAVCIVLLNNTIIAQDTRLVRDPAISKNKISFVYAGDIWVADLNGGNVKRITAFEGVEADPH